MGLRITPKLYFGAEDNQALLRKPLGLSTPPTLASRDVHQFSGRNAKDLTQRSFLRRERTGLFLWLQKEAQTKNYYK